MTRTQRRKTKREADLLQELRNRANEIHELKQTLNEVTYPLNLTIARQTTRIEQLEHELGQAIAAQREMLLWCPACGDRHIDEGAFATKEHHTHACQSCGMVWRPAIGPTIGVRYLPGFKNP